MSVFLQEGLTENEERLRLVHNGRELFKIVNNLYLACVHAMREQLNFVNKWLAIRLPFCFLKGFLRQQKCQRPKIPRISNSISVTVSGTGWSALVAETDRGSCNHGRRLGRA